MDVYLEVGRRRTFAAAIDWPGWCRAGRGEEAAVADLVRYGPRYAAAVRAVAPGVRPPAEAGSLRVVERLAGDATTDFGAPGAIPSADERPTDEAELERLIQLLRACWSAFDAAAAGAEGRQLATGPRGGGRALAQIRDHVRGADGSYTRQLGGRSPSAKDAAWTDIQVAFIDALRARQSGETADVGPRGGRRWPARYAVRRSAWHALDHAWEIEDRLGA